MTKRLSDGQFGPSGKKLRELSDAELREEIARRRDVAPSTGRPSWKGVKQYLANLELGPSATWPEVERAYKRLADRYHPDRHDDDPDRHQTAKDLTESLTRAYQALRRYFRQ